MMRGNEAAEPLLLEEGRHGSSEAEEAEKRRHRGGGGGDEGRGSKPATGGGSSASALTLKDSSGGGGASTSDEGEAERGRAAAEASHCDSAKKVSANTAPGAESDAENAQEVAAELVVSSSVHFECKRQMHPGLVLLETAFDVLQLIQTELQLGIGSVFLLKHGLLALVSLLMAVWDCIFEVEEELQYQYLANWRKVERTELTPGFLAKIGVPILVRIGLFPREEVSSGTWWNRKLQHAAHVITVAQGEVYLQHVILLGTCVSALYSVAKAALSGNFGMLETVTAVNAVVTILFIVYKSKRQRRRMEKLEEKLQKLREDQSLGWEVRERLHQLHQNRKASLSEKVIHFHKLVVDFPEHFFGDSNWRESEAHYIDVHSVQSDPARTGASGGVPALEDVSKLLGVKLHGCTDKGDARREDSTVAHTMVAAPGVDLEGFSEVASAILLVQGEAGAGKSTLAKMLALQATRASLQLEKRRCETSTSSEMIAASVAPLVLYLHCAQHQREASSRVSVRLHLESLLVGDNFHVSDEDWSGFVKETPIVLVLDAYDEAASRFTLHEVLQQDGLGNARSLRIVALTRSGTFETDDKAKDMFSFETKGGQISPTMRWLRPIGDDERTCSALAPLKVADGFFWQQLHLKYPGLAQVATAPLMAALLAQAQKSSALEDLGRDNCGVGAEAAADGGEATLGSRIYQNRARRRAHLISWHLKRRVEAGIESLQPFTDIDLVLHKLLLCAAGAGSTSTSAILPIRKEVWMKAGQLVARKLASLMWVHNTTVLRVSAPKGLGRNGCCAPLLATLPSLSPDGSYSRVDTETVDTAEEQDLHSDVGQQLRTCLCRALPEEVRACMDEALDCTGQRLRSEVDVTEKDMHVMLLYLLGFCCSLKILRTNNASTCEVAFTHDSFRACRLAEAMASYKTNEEAASRLWACRLLLADEHKDLITLLADITRSDILFQKKFLWRSIKKSRQEPMQPCNPGKRASHKGQDQGPESVAAANAATVLACAQVSFSGEDLSGAQLPRACLRGAVCHGTNFEGANLEEADLSHIFAEGASFRGAKLQKAWYGEYAMLKGHSAEVWCVAFSPDGRTVASGSEDRTIRVWDGASGAHLLTLEGHDEGITCVDYSPDGGNIASSSDDKTIRLWDVTTGSHIRTLEGHSDMVKGLAYSPDGTAIASASWDKTIRLWDASSGVLMQALHADDRVHGVAYHPDGKTLASSCDETILLWDVLSGSHRMTLKGHSDEVWCIAYSPDGRTIASGGSWDGSIHVWDAAEGSHLVTMDGHTGSVWALAYSPDGGTIASGSQDQTIRLWDVTSWSWIRTLASDYVVSLAYSPDGRCIAGGSQDCTIGLWDAVSGSCMLQREGNASIVRCVDFSPDGSAIASGTCVDPARSIGLWDAKSGCHMLTLEAEGDSSLTWGFSFSPNGKWIASPAASGADVSGPGIHLWNAVSGECQRLTLEGLRHEVTDVAFSPNCRTLAFRSAQGVVGDDKAVELWDTVTWSHRATLKLQEAVYRMAFSPDSKTIAAVSMEEHAIPLWDVESGCRRLLLEGHSDGVLSVAFSPDTSSICKLASGSFDYTIRVWDVAAGSQLLCLQGHTHTVNCLAFTPDGSTIASGSNDTTIRLWDAGTGVHRLTLEGHTSWVICLAFSSDGRSMASSSRNDRSIKVWQYMSSGQHSSSGAEDPPRSEGSDVRWLLQRSIQCAEPPLLAAGADFRGALGLGANAKAMLQQKGAKVD